MLASGQEAFFPFRIPKEEPPAVFLPGNLEGIRKASRERDMGTVGVFLISRSWVTAKTSVVAWAEEGVSNFRLLCLQHPWSEGTSRSHRWDLPHRESGLPGSSQAAAFSHAISQAHE